MLHASQAMTVDSLDDHEKHAADKRQLVSDVTGERSQLCYGEVVLFQLEDDQVLVLLLVDACSPILKIGIGTAEGQERVANGRVIVR